MSDTNIKQSDNALSARHERQSQKKAAHQEAARRARRKKIVKRVAYWIIGLAIVFGGWWLLVSIIGPKGPDYSQSIPILGRNHIADGSTASYNSNPPASGEHYADAAPAQFYDKELPDEQIVHNLEHGHIWIAYTPSLTGEIINNLKDFGGENVVVTPRSENDTDIALVAWGRLDKFNIEASGIDKQRIKDFISRYQNRGPERVNVPQSHLRQ